MLLFCNLEHNVQYHCDLFGNAFLKYFELEEL